MLNESIYKALTQLFSSQKITHQNVKQSAKNNLVKRGIKIMIKSNTHRKKGPLIAIVISIVVFMHVSVFAYPAEWGVAAPNVQQENTYWCWDACSVSCIDYFGTPPTQSNFCITVKGSVIDTTANGQEVCNGLSAYGYTPVDSFTSLTFTTIRTEIYNNNRPFIAGWSWNTGGAHMVVPSGYEDEATDYVEYMDPSYGAKYVRTYTWFKGGYGSGSDHSWVESVLNIN